MADGTVVFKILGDNTNFKAALAELEGKAKSAAGRIEKNLPDIGKKMLASIKQMTPQATAAVKKVVSAVSSMATATSNIFSGFAGLFSVALSPVARIVSQKLQPVTKVFQSIATNAKTVFSGISGHVGNFAKSAAGSIQATFAPAFNKIGGYVQKAGSTISSFGSSITRKLAPVGTALSDPLSKIGAGISSAASGFASFNLAAIKAFTSAGAAAIKGAATIVGKLGEIASKAQGVAGALTAALGGAILKGGFDRAINIDNAKAKLTGLGHSAESVTEVMDNALTSVKGTSFGLGEAASTAATLSASGVKEGEEMVTSLKGVAGAAAVSQRSLTDMGVIWGSVAALGKLQGQDMHQLMMAGIPVLDILGKHLGKTQKEVQEMVSSGKIDFKTFSEAMNESLGNTAQTAGKTFSGSLANVKAALSRLGEPIAGPILQGLTGIFQALIPVIDKATEAIKPFIEQLSGSLAPVVEGAKGFIEKLGGAIEGVANGPLSGLAPVIGLVAGAFLAWSAGGLAGVLGAIPGVSALLGPLTSLLGGIGGPIGICVAAFLGLTAASPELQGALGNLLGVFGEIGGIIASSFGPAIGDIASQVPGIVQAISGGLADGINSLADILKNAEPYIQTFCDVLKQVAGFIGDLAGQAADILGPAFESMVGMLKSGFDQIVQGFQTAWGIIEPLLPTIIGVFTTIATLVVGELSTIASVVMTVLGGAFQIAGAIISGAMQAISGVIQTVCGVIQTIIGVFVGVFTGNWQMAADGAQNIVGGIGNFIGGVFNALVGTLTGILNTIAQTFQAAFNGIFGTVKNIFTNIGNAIGDKMGAARDKVRGIIDAIKGFFSFKISWPHIPVPHFSINPSGWKIGDLLQGSIPSLGISWHAEGARFDGPTVFASGHGFGEAGTEYALPLNRTSLLPLAQNLAELMGELNRGSNRNGDIAYLAHRIDVMGVRLSQALAQPVEVNYNRREVARVMREAVPTL